MPRILLSLVLLFGASPAFAFGFGVGSHAGLVSISSDVENSGSNTVLAWPSNPVAYQTGLRLMAADTRHTHEVQFDSGLFLIDQAGSTLSMFAGMFSYQYTILSRRSTAPFANLGLGWYREGGGERSSTKRSYGAGIGVRHIVREGHGALRAELRGDRLLGDATLGRPRLTTLGLRLGFDLWL